MVKHLIIFGAFLFMTSCGEKDFVEFESLIPEECENGFCTFNFSDNSQVQIEDESYGRIGHVTDGDNLVFKYLYQYDDEPGIADDELTTELIFEVPANQNTFSISGEGFIDHKVLYRMICFCGKISHEFPSTGSITGTRLSPNLWQVTASLTIDYYAEFNGDFDPIVIEFNTVFALD